MIKTPTFPTFQQPYSDIFSQAVEATYQQELLKFPQPKAFRSEVFR